MTPEETAKVLTKIQLGDNRQADRLTLAEWHDTIGDLPFEDAILAVSMHRRDSLDYLQPAHIRKNVQRIWADRAEEAKVAELNADPGKYAPKPNNWDAMCAAWNNPVAWAREVAIYDQQLLDAGYEPTQSRYDRSWVA
jgi:hypothetical protein